MGKKYRYASSSSSSSDSDSESSSVLPPPRRHRHRDQTYRNRRRSPPAPEYPSQGLGAAPAAKEEEKKKKKKKPPPQQGIDKIWELFSQKKFSKALAVLPFSPVPPSSSGERANELLSAGYDRAVEECRQRVRKIIAECKRINTRYRDRWDIDWDLKWEKGHCLNSLGSTKFDINMSTMLNPNANIPKAVKRVHEIYEKPTFMEKVLPGDIKQGNLGNCWFVASLTGLANVEDGIKRICVEYDTKIGIYGFVFYRDGEWVWSIIDDKLHLKSPCWDSPSMQRDLLQQIDREDVERVYRKTYQTGSKALFFAQNKDQNETWVPLIEKAYAKAHGDYACLTGGWIGEALEDLSGGVTTELLASDILDTEEFWNNELSRINQEFLFGCSTGLLDGGYGNRDGISEGHAYVIMEARTLKNGTRLLKLRNPWGKIKKGNWEGAWSDGSKEWTTEVQEEINHSFGGDSTFWISYEDLLRKYQHFDRTRLFRDPNWRCCQRWIGVEVPWKAQYHEKFHIKLTKDSPLVLTLSQLDARYFKGLQGQYNFRLQFRLHEQGRPDAEDYIVRSHGNYLMDRSVSVELPNMPAGSYTVFISVIGERDSKAPSVEDVVKRECKRRVENEKLAQVGHAYDLAHSKGAAHLEALAKLRKKTDSGKASDARKTERRKMWEKRHLQRDIQKKQGKKNTAKRDRRKAREAEEKAKAAEVKRVQEEKEAEEKRMQLEKEAEEKRLKEERESEERKKIEELQPKDKAIQTEHEVKSEVKDGSPQPEILDDKSDSASTSSSSTPQYTPKSDSAVPSDDDKENTVVVIPPVDASAVSGGPPPATTSVEEVKAKDEQVAEDSNKAPAPPAAKTKPPPPPPAAEDSDGDSSDSPVEDWEELYSSDDMSLKPRMAPVPAQPAKKEESDDEEPDTPDPWNAIAIVGFRVYSMDENLELRVVLEGGNLEEGGMGEKGEADIDNAQSNAGGQRKKEQKDEDKKDKKEDQKQENDKKAQDEKTDEANKDETKADSEAVKKDDDTLKPVDSKSGDGFAAYKTIIVRQTSEFDRVMGEKKQNDASKDLVDQESMPVSETIDNDSTPKEDTAGVVVDETSDGFPFPAVPDANADLSIENDDEDVSVTPFIVVTPDNERADENE
ncbi:putative calpain family cysteine protease protein [Phaeoacremonium minimum UCRPA7]|uniref:Putative calpain family cysteine protease protein n=1 Tax=Phaeoacremonium minimum (strain UCR-PA7) TaxID=1286976 RepID=R8BPT7_PHAM7|nr:putative calpain family cysteine protease protein [Phaeoacremonium minimum UCRPA7]EOO01398.1 putative calpain family cysteine protease protein [Phaeoacremonium minimum UCRPA7]